MYIGLLLVSYLYGCPMFVFLRILFHCLSLYISFLRPPMTGPYPHEHHDNESP